MHNKGFISPVVLLVIVAVALSTVAYFVFVRPASAPVVQDTTQTTVAQTKTYTNSRYGYTLQYPSDWIVEPEKQIVDGTNKIYSYVKIHDPTDSKSIDIQVDAKEWMLKYEALQQDKIIIDGTDETAYIFPSGYESCEEESPKACSFFEIPIKRGNTWYDLGAKGDAQTVSDFYRNIFSTFHFSHADE
jgi:hypothetical protein